MKIAVLLATYNRREKTLSCLQSLAAQQLPKEAAMEVFLTDDNSADGTAAAVKAIYPQTHLFHGNGQLYWAGGMRNTWRQALTHNPDYYLLVNDDTVLYSQAITTLLQMSGNYPSAICVGSTCDASTGTWSYGGSKLRSKKLWGGKKVFDENEIVDGDFANANIMLVPAGIVQQIGILSTRFTHSLADYDYCLKAKKNGFTIKIAPGFLGSCVDDHGNNWKSRKTTLKERIQYLKSPKGIAYSEYMFFIRQHFPLSYPAEFGKLWMKTFFPVIWDKYKK